MLAMQGKQVEYSLRALPLAGYVAFPDNVRAVCCWQHTAELCALMHTRICRTQRARYLRTTPTC